MKKGLLLLALLILLGIGFTYFFIPNQFLINRTIVIKFPRTGMERILFDTANWNKWWPSNNEMKQDSSRLEHDDYEYSIDGRKISTLLLNIKDEEQTIPTALNLFFYNNDSAIIEWNGVLPGSNNPFKRIGLYFKAKNVGNGMDDILEALQDYLADEPKVYGVKINNVPLQDSVVAFTSKTSLGYPSTSFIYTMITDIRNMVKSNGLKEMNSPMLNVDVVDSNNYLVKVAIPVDRQIEPSGDIIFKKLVKTSAILVAEVTGGNGKVSEAFHSIETYMSDHDRTAPAIPFLSLITDRINEPDSNKWVTRIYYPVR